MPKITQVEKQQKNPRRFNIYLDGKFAFGADEDLIVSYRLLPGKIIAEQDLAKLLLEAEAGKLLDHLYSLFARRQRSEQEVRTYLQQLSYQHQVKGQGEISGMVITLVIDRLMQKNLINDLEFAKAWVDARRRSQQKGKIALKNELRQKGIANEIIEEVLNNETIQQSNNEEYLATQALEKKLRNWSKLSTLEFKQKAYGFLARKGFDSGTISKLLSPAMIANYLKKE